MIISFICGGLGNQMFQYAAGRRLAVHHRTKFKLDLREYRGGTDAVRRGLEQFTRPVRLFELSVSATAATDHEIFQLRDRFGSSSFRDRIVRNIGRRLKPNWLWPASHFQETRFVFDPAVMDLLDQTYLDGYWQSWKYFDDIVPVIRREFAIKDPTIAGFAKSYADDLRKAGDPIVAVHVRRGDLAHAAETLKSAAGVYGLPVGLPYLRAAMNRFGRGHRFLVFSDTAADIAWCRANLVFDEIPADRFAFSEGHTDLQDMALMSACDHNIIANSTFSWWSAYLNTTPGRRVVAPSVWSFTTGPKKMVPDTLIPPDWELI
jgi:hypothetical protein